MEIPQLLAVTFDSPIMEKLSQVEIPTSAVLNYEEATQRISSQKYTAGIVEMSSCHLNELLSFRQAFPKFPIIVAMTENSQLADIINFLKAGAFALLPMQIKSGKLETLCRTVEKSTGEDGLKVISGTPFWIEVTIPAQLTYVIRLNSFFEQIIMLSFASKSGKIFIAFRELLQNAVEHGCEFSPEKEVKVRWIKSSRFVLCQISDEGEGFDRESLPHAAIGGKEQAREAIRYRKRSGMRPGGLGICYASGASDEIIYNEKGNSVAFVKYFSEIDSQDTL